MPFIDPRTKEKIIYNEPMDKHVPPEQLRKSHGGILEFEYEHARYWPALNKLAEQRREQQYQRWVKGGKMIGEFEMYLKGGQEESLRSTMTSAVEKTAEKLGELQVGEKAEKKRVSMADLDEEGKESKKTEQTEEPATALAS